MKTCAVLAACIVGIFAFCPAASAQQTVPEHYAEAMLRKLGGAHLTRDPQAYRIKTVGLVNVGPTNQALSLVAALPAVTELEVVAHPWQDFDDRGLSYLRGMTQLEQLQLVGPRITDRGMANLAGLTNLDLLSIDAPITDAALAHLAGMTQLRLLDLYGTRIMGEGFADLTGLAQLEFLNLDRTPIRDAGLEHVGQLTGLRTLLLRDTRVTDQGMERLAQLPNLERLDLDRTAITDQAVSALAGVIGPQLMTYAGPTQLREISLRGAPNLRGDNLAAIANLYGLPFVRRVDIAQTPIAADPAKVEALERAEQLVEHWRTLPTIRSEGPLVRFDENLNLYGLYFVPPSFAVSREALDELFAYPPITLQELSLREAPLRQATMRDPSDLQKISKLTGLRRLNLYKTGVANEDLQHLQGLTNLRELYLAEDDTRVTAEGEQALKNALPDLQILRLP